MLHAAMCSCLYGFVFTLLVLVVCCTALEFCFVFVDLDGLGDVFGNSISIYLEEWQNDDQSSGFLICYSYKTFL